MNWRSIELPGRMAGLKKNRHGMPIPYIILVDDQGVEHFVVNDSAKVFDCLQRSLCAICGQLLPTDDTWLVGGPQSAFHPQGYYIDTPIHKECGEYALQVCPYLAAKNYDTMVHDVERIAGKIKMNDTTPIVMDNTVDPNRPKLFVFSRVGMIAAYPAPTGVFYLKPMEVRELQFWDKGRQLTDDEASTILAEIGYTITGDPL